jgi:hypothetical protein
MTKVIFLLPIIFLLAACGDDDSKIKDVIRQYLKDPGSAQFKDTVVSKDGERACIVWNAKNSMGGYGDWEVTELLKLNSVWVVKDIKGSEQNCSETGFKALDAGAKAEFYAPLKAMEILQKIKNISTKEATELVISGGKCSGVVGDYALYSKLVAEYRVRQDSGMLAIYEEHLKEAQAKLDAGDCQSPVGGSNPKEEGFFSKFF